MVLIMKNLIAIKIKTSKEYDSLNIYGALQISTVHISWKQLSSIKQFSL